MKTTFADYIKQEDSLNEGLLGNIMAMGSITGKINKSLTKMKKGMDNLIPKLKSGDKIDGVKKLLELYDDMFTNVYDIIKNSKLDPDMQKSMMNGVLKGLINNIPKVQTAVEKAIPNEKEATDIVVNGFKDIAAKWERKL